MLPWTEDLGPWLAAERRYGQRPPQSGEILRFREFLAGRSRPLTRRRAALVAAHHGNGQLPAKFLKLTTQASA